MCLVKISNLNLVMPLDLIYNSQNLQETQEQVNDTTRAQWDKSYKRPFLQLNGLVPSKSQHCRENKRKRTILERRIKRHNDQIEWIWGKFEYGLNIRIYYIIILNFLRWINRFGLYMKRSQFFGKRYWTMWAWNINVSFSNG